LSLAFAVCLLAGALLLARARVRPHGGARAHPGRLALPFASARFAGCLPCCSSMAWRPPFPPPCSCSLPAITCASGHYAGPFLIVYFCAAAASMPAWVALARRFGEARAWGGAMLLAATVFVWAYGLGAGAAWGFAAICLLSGLALGADLALPPACWRD
jgi:hypothetical protein